MSRAAPGRARTTGSIPRARAAATWSANEGSPKRSGTASGGARHATLVPSPLREGTNTAAGGRPQAARTARTSSVVRQGTSPGTVRSSDAPSSRPAARPRATAAVCPSPAPSWRTVAPWAAASAAAPASGVTTRTRSRPAPASAASTSSSIARASAERASLGSARASRCLAVPKSLTGTTATFIQLPA